MQAATERPEPSDLYITGELASRSLKSADYLLEKQALQTLASRMADQPEKVLPDFVDLAMELTGGVSAGLSLYESDPSPGVFRWRYLRGALAPFEDATTPRNFSPCGVTLDRNGPVLSNHPERFYDWISNADIIVPEVLLVPLYIGSSEPLGTLWIVAGKEGHFDSGDVRIATELAKFVGIALRMIKAEQQLQRALELQETLTREMSHRIKNLFAVAEGMVRIGARATESKDELAQTLIGRFHALAGAHGLIRKSFSADPEGLRVSDLSALLRTIVSPHEREGDGAPRFKMNGPAVALGEQAINGMALVFHELATNSLKHGAAKVETGKVDINWSAEGDDLDVVWIERGGPMIHSGTPAFGYGSKLLNDTVVRQFRGKIEHDWAQSGLTVSIAIPLKQLGT